jgi:hypothetical protein
MWSILGAFDHPPSANDGSFARRHSMPGPVGAHPDPTTGLSKSMQNRIRSYRSRKATEEKFDQITSELEYLHDHHIPDSQPWISFEPARSFDDWVEKNRRAAPSLREALEADLKALRQRRHDTDAELRDVVRGIPRERAQIATGDFAREIERVLTQIKDGGPFDSSQYAEARENASRAIHEWQTAVKKDPSRKNVVELMKLLKTCMLLGFDDDMIQGGMNSVGDAVETNRKMAQTRFRTNPTSKNLSSYLGIAKQSALLGGEGYVPSEPLKLPETTQRYTVKAGDTLSSIAIAFYGSADCWDRIWLANSAALSKGVDTLQLGLELTIPN